MCFIASPCSQVVSYQDSSSLCAPPSLSVMTNGPLLFISGNYRSSVSFFIWKFFFFYLRINKISCYIDRTFYLSSRRVFNFSKRKRVRNATVLTVYCFPSVHMCPSVHGKHAFMSRYFRLG